MKNAARYVRRLGRRRFYFIKRTHFSIDEHLVYLYKSREEKCEQIESVLLL